jgi:hypothetical protein
MANPTRPEDRGRIAGQHSAGQAASELKDRAKETAGGVAQQARETASSMADKARETAASAARTAGGVASAVGDRVEDAASAVGSGMQSLAGTIRERAPQGGMMGTAASSVAGALESSGRYLKEHDLGDVGNDVLNLIRRNPIPAVLLSMGIGYLIARATRS